MKFDRLSLNPLRSIYLCGMNFYAEPDLHPDRVLAEHDLLYVMDGEWSLCQDETNHILRKDEAMFLRAGSHHYSIRPCSPNTRTIFVHFSKNENDQSSVELPIQALSEYCDGDFVLIPTVINCAQHGSVIRQMQRLMELYWSDREDKRRQLGLQLNLLLCELAYVYRERYAMNEEWLPRILENMRANPSIMYSVNELAQIAGMSARTLTTHFKRATGQSIHKYQINLKLEMAFTLVRTEPNRTLSDIASHFGFYDAYHFSRIFKNRYGFSPKHFRRSTAYPNMNRMPK